METQGCLGEGRVGLAPLVCHHLSFPSPILLLCPFYRGKLRRKGLYCKDVDPGRRRSELCRPHRLMSLTPFPLFLSSVFLTPPELATIWTWDPRSWWDAAATSLSMDRMQPGSVRATWTVRHTSVPSPHPPQRPEWPCCPGSPSSGLTTVSACTAAPGAVWNRKAPKSLSKGSWVWAVSGLRGVSSQCWVTSRSLTFSVPFSVFLDFPHSCCLCLSPAHLP